MKRLDTFLGFTIAKTALVTLALIVLIWLLFDLFAQLEFYLDVQLSAQTIVRLTLLEAPQGVVLGLGPALLFAVTYVLSSLQAQNGFLIFFSAGIPYRRIIVSALMIGVIASLGLFLFNEQVAIEAAQRKQALLRDVTRFESGYDNRDVTLRSPDGSYVVHVGRYHEKSQTIERVTVIYFDENRAIKERIDADGGIFMDSFWQLSHVKAYRIDEHGQQLLSFSVPLLDLTSLNLEPQLFRNLQTDIKSLPLRETRLLMQRLKVVDPQRFRSYNVDLQQRLWTNLNPLIMVLISCSTLWNWKKNVLLFSILASISIAVVYFVTQMVTSILASQFVIGATSGALIPMALLAMFALGAVVLKRR